MVLLMPLLAGIGVPGPFLAHDPSLNHLDAVVAVQIDGRRRCGAVYISARLALSIASCFMRSLALTLDEQRACVRGECDGTLVDVSSVRLIGGADARAGLVVARVTRIAVRLTAWWAVPAVCTQSLCGEGWDVALLELDPSCAHGELPCVPPVRLASVPATIGLAPLAVGFGAHPGFDRRAEFHLSLSGSGGGVRRSSAARVRQVASHQLLQAELSARPGERAGPFCDGDLGAALLTNRAGQWQVEGLHVPESLVRAQPPTDAAASCAAPSGRVLSAHVVRCWLESIARTWGIGPVVLAHVAECGELDFYPPELAEMRIGGGATLAALSDEGDCATVACERGACVAGGRCECFPGYFGPRCTLRGPAPPLPAAARWEFLVAPNGTDAEGCGHAAAPCATLRKALALQCWQHLSGRQLDPHSDKHAVVTLAPGTYAGDGQAALELHGNRVTITSAAGAAHSILDCAPPSTEESGQLFVGGESAMTEVKGLTLRRCLTEQQVHHAIAPHPSYAVHVAGPARWPETRQGALFRANVWVPD